MSLLGELRRKGVPCPLVGAQQIHRDATLRAHCVPGHTRAAWTASHFFFFFCVPHVFLSTLLPFKIPLSGLSIPSAPLPFLREALDLPQALSDPSIPPRRLPAFSLLLLQVASHPALLARAPRQDLWTFALPLPPSLSPLRPCLHLLEGSCRVPALPGSHCGRLSAPCPTSLFPQWAVPGSHGRSACP